MMEMRKALAFLASMFLAIAPAFANVKDLKGFDKKVYTGALALYASSHELGIRDRFICTAQVIGKAGNRGYYLLSAGHCTPANPGLPSDMEFSVSDDLGQSLTPVTLLQSAMDESKAVDYSEFYLRTDKKYPMMELGDESDARIGDETIDVNFSLALGKFASKGHVSSKIAENGEAKGFLGVDQFDSHGASGSSVVDERTKKVIGIVIAGVDGATVSTWVEPISRIKKELLKATLPRTQKVYAPLPRIQYVPVPDIPALPVVPIDPILGSTEQPKQPREN
jgi:hypothetical protein